ncbi:MAG: hypothetical protein ABS92_04705 [Thiobacillus sp. SCN 63-374]|nr:MAG: hypothetical protein ABS92_04705 [Thiobacillus sp. SCN 63-374]
MRFTAAVTSNLVWLTEAEVYSVPVADTLQGFDAWGGLTYYRARYYHPGLGRFASRDPMGMADSVSPYAYVANNPINLIDPFGMEAALAGTTMNPAYWGMTDAGGWLSGVVDSARQRLTDFASGLDVGGAVDQFGRKLAYDFVQNNQGTFGAYGWMANQLAPYAQGYDGSTPNGQLAAIAAIGATLTMPGGGISKAKNAANGAHAYSVAFETTIPKLGLGTRPEHFKSANTALESALKNDSNFAQMAQTLVSASRPIGVRAQPIGPGTMFQISRVCFNWYREINTNGGALSKRVPPSFHLSCLATPPILQPGMANIECSYSCFGPATWQSGR